MKEIIILKDKDELLIEYEIIISEFERFFVICLEDEISEFERLLRCSSSLKFCLLNYKHEIIQISRTMKMYWNYRINNLKNEDIKIIMKDKSK